jgi:hypothetical protein
VLLDYWRKVREVGVVEEARFRRRAIALRRFFNLALAPFLDLLRRAALLDPLVAELLGQDVLDQIS